MQKEHAQQTTSELSSAARRPDRADDRRKAPDPRQSWTVSVVVPTCGRADLLDRCLSALTVQTVRAADIEIIVVDDAVLEATRTAIAGWSERMAPRGLALRYIANHGPHGPAAARNRGWRAARAGVIAFTDDDTVPDPDWLRNALLAFGDDVDALWGRIIMPLPEQPTDYERDAGHLSTAEFVTANCLCRKAVLDALGGFDERFRMAWREDSDFHFRLLELGARIRHVPQAVVVHPVRPAPWGVSIGQQKKIQFDALLYKKHPLLYRRKIRSTPRWDYYLTVASLLAAPASATLGHAPLAAGAAAVWVAMTARMCRARLQHTAKTAAHVVEMALTSAAIPVLAVWWRMVGALRFRVLFL